MAGTSARPLRLGIIGAGIMGRQHALTFDYLPQTELVAVADLNEERARELAETYHVPRWFADYNEMLNQVDLDAVSMAVPDHVHRDPALAVIRAGRHLLMEKPLAITVPDAEAIYEAAQEAGIKLSVRFTNRWQLPTIQAKAAVDRGELGDPIYAYTRMINTLHVPTQMLSWSSHTRLAHWLISHAVDRTRWFFGAEATKVYAVSRTGVLQGMGLDTPDVYHATVEFENGAFAAFESYCILPETMPTMAGGYFQFLGSKGWLQVDNNAPTLKIATPERYVEPPARQGLIFGEPTGSVHEGIKDFVKKILEDRDPLITAYDGLQVARICCAIDDAAARGEAIVL